MKTKSKIRMLPLILTGISLLFINGCQKEEESSEIKDKDGNIYTSLTIGSQVWMAENLKTTKYNDGTAIPLMTYSYIKNPGYTWCEEDAALYKESYGALYNWYAVNTKKLCPSGWHVPTDAEWHTLILNLDGNAQNVTGIESETAGGKLKETGTAHWKTTSTSVTNESGFNGLPGGHCHIGDPHAFYYMGYRGLWWTATEFNDGSAWLRDLRDNDIKVYRGYLDKGYGFSVRCIKN
ncbi:MAG: fibrobacter succinogenes major paralogous domain-containing protein [Bacteroidales bacterium]|jgi:uncharacterized protein (TIGR02145 family)|nr:fibrobacter succinogenes major paralogous domain-containing protein [Bacteroidales bacterium]MDX9925839.1 fibrobacter succinogenes major paralogous domain-containing protein [Bacteroidales bacterium]HNX84065.1 fibrobacter succinogenes major paralogous domain-containing protein [Bacteroidales bacterium]HOC47721.1 fibrobacter succinogenes major paralogous domain-containing protein [Bacteroidales bacterium]HPS97513.1 fibrobacter succinogenes major paralogous domain-containing protein [Bacteroid